MANIRKHQPVSSFLSRLKGFLGGDFFNQTAGLKTEPVVYAQIVKPLERTLLFVMLGCLNKADFACLSVC